jgi:RND family efflux transporter MFP subunit
MTLSPNEHAARHRRFLIIASIGLLLVAAAVWFMLRPSPAPVEEEAQASPQHGVSLTPAQRIAAGIAVTLLKAVPLPRVFEAPGEVRTNDYTSSIVAPRVVATVVSRTAKLGDTVTAGQPLLTLYSTDMAAAQSAFLLAERNLERLRDLKDIVAGQRMDEAVAARQEARGRLESYGLTKDRIDALAKEGLENTTLGQFILSAPRAGTITQDAFHLGDVVEPGKTLFEIADLASVWVEARVSPVVLPEIRSDEAKVIAGNIERKAKVVQKSRTVDEVTRTAAVRLEVENADGALRPGQFVDVALYGAAEPVLAVPSRAVLTDESGNALLYVEAPDGTFESRKVTALYTSGDDTAIAGIEAGAKVVTAGAFFVRSEENKASFGDDD